METDLAGMNDTADTTILPENNTQNVVEESALSQDSEFDDLPGFPETTNLAEQLSENENEEPNSLEAVNEEISLKGKNSY